MSIHEFTPEHLQHVAEFWHTNITGKNPIVEENQSGHVCACCGIAMHPGLAHFVYPGKLLIEDGACVGQTRIHVCSDCVARHADYVEFCGITCADCGEPIEHTDAKQTNTDGDPVCDDCWDDTYCECADCGEVIRQNDAFENTDGDRICESCRDNYCICEDCDSIVHGDNVYDVGNSHTSRHVCGSCFDLNYIRCDDCDGYFSRDESISLANGNMLCQECYGNGDYTCCAGCGDPFHSSDGSYCERDDEWYCDRCYTDRPSAAIHAYGYKPDWIRHQTAADRKAYPCIPDRFYLGVELEVENKARSSDNEDTAARVTEIVPAVCKHDGSINNGFEIVFHPQTFDYAKTEGNAAIADMLDYLRKEGFAGHNYGGMHVHVSKEAFSRLHLYKFHRLFLHCENLFTFISQRKATNLSQWASFGNMGSEPHSQAGRYAALNYTRHTVEVRIFNSTIRTDRFFKNLEAVKAAIDYSKHYGIRDMQPANFLRFIMNNRHMYKNLVSFLVECTSDTLTAAHVDARAVKQVQKNLSRRSA